MGDLGIDVCSHPWHLSFYGYLWSMAFGACGDGRWKEQTVGLRSAPCQQQPTDSSACTDTLICPQCSTDLLCFIYAMKFNKFRVRKQCSFLFLSSRCPVPIQRGASQPWWHQQRLCNHRRWICCSSNVLFSFLISWDIFIKTNIEVEDLFCQMVPGKTFKVCFFNHTYISSKYLILSNVSMNCIDGWICIFHDMEINLNTTHRQLYFIGFAIFGVEHF